MTVKKMKELLNGFNDDDRIIIDNGEYEANEANEVLYAFKIKKSHKPEAEPVVILQVRSDIDVFKELTSSIKHYESIGASKDEIHEMLTIQGYTQYEIERAYILLDPKNEDYPKPITYNRFRANSRNRRYGYEY